MDMYPTPKYQADIFRILRGVAMLCVFGVHAKIVISNASPQELNFPWFLYTPAWAAMWIFFGLSGYFIGAQFYQGKCNSIAQIKNFFINRLIRIGVPYFVFLGIFAFFINPTEFVEEKASWWNLLTFTFDGISPVDGLSALWFVSTIVQLYVAAPILYHLFFKHIPSRYVVFVMLGFLGVGYTIRYTLLWHYSINWLNWFKWIYSFSPMQWDIFFVPFLLNALKPCALPTLWKAVLQRISLILLFLLLVLFGNLIYFNTKIAFYKYAGPTIFTLLLTCIIYLFRTGKPQHIPLHLSVRTIFTQPWCLIECLAVISYNFYLYHSNILFIIPGILQNYPYSFSPNTYLGICVIGGFILCTLWSWAIYLLLERPINLFRKKIFDQK